VLGPRLVELGANLRAQTLQELQDSLPAMPEPPAPVESAAAVGEALAEGTPLYADLAGRLSEKIAPRLESALAGWIEALAGDLNAEVLGAMRTEIEALVPEAAARVIREEIAALAEDDAAG
jgi:hypothetical protein